MKKLKIFTPDDFPLPFPTAITIGSFDGIHRGHKALFKRTLELSNKLNIPAVVVTFNPHPKKVLYPEAYSEFLTTFEEKLELIQTTGIHYVCIIPFTKALSELSADLFVEKYLIDGLNIKAVVVGFNFRFGKKREGNIELLKKLGEKYDFIAESLPPIKVNNLTVSSSTIKGLIKQREIAKANELLGYNYFFSGKVISGKGRGAKLGFPTANLKVPEEKLIPPNGVYGVKVYIKDRVFYGAMNIGKKPTFEDKELSIEVHIFDFSESILGETIKVEVLTFVRDEKKFDSTEVLIKQIQKDCDFLRKYFSIKGKNS